MQGMIHTIGLRLVVGLVLVLVSRPPAGAQPTVEEVKAAAAAGVAWLAAQQHPDGFWASWWQVGATALACKKLMHHAVDPKWGLGLPSPFDGANPYKENVERCVNWLLKQAQAVPIGLQPAGDPDTDGDGLGVQFPGSFMYEQGIGLMMLCEAVELDRTVTEGLLAGQTYKQVAEDLADYIYFCQNEGASPGPRGGWRYGCNDASSDNSVSGWVALGLGFAETAPPAGCGFTIPQWVKNELTLWVNHIQTPATGCSGYHAPGVWDNVLKTGNLLQQLALIGAGTGDPRVQNALKCQENLWNQANPDPGWNGGAGPASYQACFAAMKGFTSQGIHEFGDPPIDWQTDFETELLAEQLADGSWPACIWGDPTLCTTWALLCLQKAAPPPPSLPGRMTGGGSVFLKSMRFTHGFELHCDTSLPNNLEINWGKGNKFHLTTLTSARCSDDPSLEERPPVAGFDTFKGSGVGRLNGAPGATIEFTFTDAGEPGKGVDLAVFTITPAGGGPPISVSGTLQQGNHQAHAP